MISICIPAYENALFLKRALDSAVVQVGVDFEIIVSDDSRSNSVKELVNSYSFPIKYFHNSLAMGSPKNWNSAVSRASGDIIHLLHHDDAYYSYDSLKKMVSPILHEGKIFSFSQCLWAPYGKIECFRRGINKETYERLKLGFFGDLFAINFLSVPSTMVYRKTSSILYDESFINMVDVDFYLNMLKNFGAEGLGMVESPCVVVNIESDFQVTNSLVNEALKREEWERFYHKWREFLLEIGDKPEELYSKALKHQGLS